MDDDGWGCSITATPDAPVIWHLDPTVWQRAISGRHEALIWWTGPGPRLAWCIYQIGGLDPVILGTGADEIDAKAQAEATLRHLNMKAGS
jgi:hypothetical protein